MMKFKPRFLTRQEREALALKKREEEVARQRETQRDLIEKRKAFLQNAKKHGLFFANFDESYVLQV